MTSTDIPSQPTKQRILITVKTYPLPSTTSLREMVCTAGVREDGSFIRLYPIDYRYRPYWQWYKKYQWVEAVIQKNKKDYRPETFELVKGASLQPIGQPISTARNWAERRKFVLAQGVQTMCGLQVLDDTQRSLGIIRPRVVSDLAIEETDRQWKPAWEALFKQLSLWGPGQKPLEKVPYKFFYVFTCEHDGCKGHRMMIEDWEVGQLYRAMRDKHGSEQIAVSKVRDKLLGQICAPGIDTHFFVGTVIGHGTWIILGTFWPKKT